MNRCANSGMAGEDRPAAIVRCLSVEDVIHTVRWTRAHGLPLSVRGAGHDFRTIAAREWRGDSPR